MGRWTQRAPGWLLWLLFVTIATCFVLLPLGRFVLVLSPSPEHYDFVRMVLIAVLVGWMLARPVLVAVTDLRRPATPEPSDTGVTVVIPCHNASRKIGRTVSSLVRQTHRPIEIVLVENNSSDVTWEVLQRLVARYPEVRVFTVGEHRDVYAASIAINRGVMAASHDVILRLDDDTQIATDAVARALAELESQAAVAVACNLRTANPQDSVWTRLQAIEYLFAMDVDRRAQDLFGSIVCCSGGMAMFKREAITRSGGFVFAPPQVSEDMDMTLKSHRLGHVTIAPEAIGFTEVPVSLKDLFRQRFRWGISGTVSLYLHRRGLLNRSYWHAGAVGFIGLPIRAAIALRDLLAPIVLLDMYLLLAHDGPFWMGALLVSRAVILWVEMLLLLPALHWEASRQGLGHWWLSPLFVLLYGPILLLARFLGTWAGVKHIMDLRRDLDRVEAGLRSDSTSPDEGRPLAVGWVGS